VIGAGGLQALGAQQKPHPEACVISEIELTNPKACARECVPLANKALAEDGQERLASGGATSALAGDPPASRTVLSVFEGMEAARAACASPAYPVARKIGDKYAKFRIFAADGLQLFCRQ
jgi:uncharacterized protein (DUF1330 family)